MTVIIGGILGYTRFTPSISLMSEMFFVTEYYEIVNGNIALTYGKSSSLSKLRAFVEISMKNDARKAVVEASIEQMISFHIEKIGLCTFTSI